MSPKPGIPSFYYYFFLWVDPIMCFPGVYLYLFDHKTVLDRGIPHHLHQALLIPPSLTPSPLTSYLLTLLGFFFLLIFTLQITLMRQSLNYPSHITISIWRMFMLAILIVDFGLIYISYAADPKGLMNPMSWVMDDWGGYGTIATVVLARTAFLLGIGGVGKEDNTEKIKA